MRDARYLLFIATITLSLTACHRRSETSTPHAAAAAPVPTALQARAALTARVAAEAPIAAEGDEQPALANDDRPQTLMRAVYPDWEPGQAPSEHNDDQAAADEVIKPWGVIEIDATHRLLVVTREVPNGGHAEAGKLEAHVFERAGDRWTTTKGGVSRIETGFSGSVGDLAAIDYGPGHRGLVVSNGSCWQGACGGWTEFYLASAQGLRSLTNQMTYSDTSGMTEGCSQQLAGGESNAASSTEDDAEQLAGQDCADITGKWHLGPLLPSGWADLVLEFEGSEVVYSQPPKLQDIAETLVLRYDGSAYKAVSGHNPAHPL